MRAVSLGLACLLLAGAAAAAPRRVCVDGVCRVVEDGPLARDFRQDVNAAPPRPAARPRVADWKFWLVNGVNLGVGIATTRTITRCRADHGIGPCVDGGYGPFGAREALRHALNVGTVGVSWEIKRIEDEEAARFKGWWLLPVALTAWDATAIARNAWHTFPPREVER